MSHTFSCFFLSLFILLASAQASANNSVPVTDLANDIGTYSEATSKPLEPELVVPKAVVPKIVEPSPVILKLDPAKANANAQMFDLVELLKRELQQLRGKVEELTYTLDRLKQDQKQRYLDLDRRVVSLSNQPSAANTSQTTLAVGEPIQINESISNTPGDVPLDTVIVIQETYDPAAEKLAYKAAFTLIRERQYDASIEALLTFVKDYPQGALLGNAHYWLGEVYMVQGDASLAASSFEYVISEFPEHRKIPDALYKAGVAYQNVGDAAKANALLKRVLSEYPDSSAARLAQERVN